MSRNYQPPRLVAPARSSRPPAGSPRQTASSCSQPAAAATRYPLPATRYPQRNRELYQHSPVRMIADGESVTIAVQLLETRSRIREPNAAAVPAARRIRGHARAVIANRHAKRTIIACDRHGHLASLRSRRHAVLDCVLHQRLQDETRDAGVE